MRILGTSLACLNIVLGRRECAGLSRVSGPPPERSSGGDGAAQEVDDLARRRSGTEDLGDAHAP